MGNGMMNGGMMANGMMNGGMGMPYMPQQFPVTGPSRPYQRRTQPNSSRPYNTGTGDQARRNIGATRGYSGTGPRVGDGTVQTGPTRTLVHSAGLTVHNDYSENFFWTGARPQNFIRTSEENDPSRAHLLKLKDDLVEENSLESMCLNVDLHSFDLRSLDSQFDVLLVDPPWDTWSQEELMNLNLGEISAPTAFMFLWCGSDPETVERACALMEKWKFNRCEDIVWIKTNKTQCSDQEDKLDDEESELVKEERAHAERVQPKSSLFIHTVEHCLLGRRGKAHRRDTNTHQCIHTNVDYDVIVGEEDPRDAERKPEELYRIIERFCLGTRRLELFGRDHNCRRGWITLGNQLTENTWDPERYADYYRKKGTKLPVVPEIENCRPRSRGSSPERPLPYNK